MKETKQPEKSIPKKYYALSFVAAIFFATSSQMKSVTTIAVGNEQVLYSSVGTMLIPILFNIWMLYKSKIQKQCEYNWGFWDDNGHFQMARFLPFLLFILF